ncbi:mycothiol system anti-sigma-R factor [Rhabdothermincola sediminis]|uniref:mycothiol system anti-sigma-R factor n=1 Tax=Rhabdothermincola sediminis TaxID=2751370 RepID=UPI001AA09937|nr:mycothiol system anti-sigma-R factor [Rhabdothermincola sediminis]
MGDHHRTDCNEALRELYVFLDGELTEERRSVIARHLDDCNPCLEVFDFEAELRLVIQQKCREKVPPELRQRIEETLRSLSTAPDQPPR